MAKRGRPRKKSHGEQSADEEAETSRLTHTTATALALSRQPVTKPTSSPRGFLSAPMYHPPAPSRYLTRQAKMVIGLCATSTSPLRSPVRCLEGITSPYSTLTPTKRVLSETSYHNLSPATGDVPTLNNFTSKPPFQTQVLSTPASSSRFPILHASTCGKTTDNPNNSVSAESEDWSNPPANDLLDIGKFASKLLHQSQDGKKLHLDAPSAPHEVVLPNNLPSKEASEIPNRDNKEEESPNNLDQKVAPAQSLSLNLTEMAAMSNDSYDPDEVMSALHSALVTVSGYRVKEEFASLLRYIFSKYGDIAKDSSLKTMRSRSSFLEMVCEIYQTLEGTKFMDLTPIELQSMLVLIGDIESDKFEVGWLHKRLDEIYEAKMLLNSASSLKQAKARNNEAIKELEQEVDGYKAQMRMLQEKIYLAEDKLCVIKAESENINQKAMVMKTKVKCFYGKSLVDGLL